MEALKMPMREIRERYTKSELMIMGWHAAEQSYFMRRRSKGGGTSDKGVHGSVNPQNQGSSDPLNAAERVLEERLGSTIIEKMVDQDGNIDLRGLTGPQALHFMKSIGVNIAPRVAYGG